MKAIVQDRYGSPDVLLFREIDGRVVGDGEVLVRVRAAGVDQGVWHLLAGLPYLMRIAGFGLRAPKGPVRGYDVAGRVEAVGANVTRFQSGDEVFGTCRGSFAEYACARADRLAPKPANLSFEQAAAVSISGYAALQAVRDQGKVRPGQRVLIIGAGGGVGTFAVQLAKAFGAEVTGVCSTTKLELVRSIGADSVIDYTSEDFADSRTRGRPTSSTTCTRSGCAESVRPGEHPACLARDHELLRERSTTTLTEPARAISACRARRVPGRRRRWCSDRAP